MYKCNPTIVGYYDLYYSPHGVNRNFSTPIGRGTELEHFELNSAIGNYGLQVPKGVFHTLIANEPSVFMESKAGKYESVKKEDLLEK